MPRKNHLLGPRPRASLDSSETATFCHRRPKVFPQLSGPHAIASVGAVLGIERPRAEAQRGDSHSFGLLGPEGLERYAVPTLPKSTVDFAAVSEQHKCVEQQG